MDNRSNRNTSSVNEEHATARSTTINTTTAKSKPKSTKSKLKLKCEEKSEDVNDVAVAVVADHDELDETGCKVLWTNNSFIAKGEEENHVFKKQEQEQEQEQKELFQKSCVFDNDDIQQIEHPDYYKNALPPASKKKRSGKYSAEVKYLFKSIT